MHLVIELCDSSLDYKTCNCLLWSFVTTGIMSMQVTNKVAFNLLLSHSSCLFRESDVEK